MGNPDASERAAGKAMDSSKKPSVHDTAAAKVGQSHSPSHGHPHSPQAHEHGFYRQGSAVDVSRLEHTGARDSIPRDSACASSDLPPHVADVQGRRSRRPSTRNREKTAALVVGHYCHDRITLHGGAQVEALGGSVSYITNVFCALGMDCEVASNVGPDFLYMSEITHSPNVIEGHLTTEFCADFSLGEERVLKAGNICKPIQPYNIPALEFELGLAVGIAGEILPETLRRMVEVSRYVIVDVQALIRTIDPKTGLVGLKNLEDTPFNDLLHGISFLKVARNEAMYINLESVREKTCVIITEGKNGSRVYCKDRKFRVPAFPALEVDPTGAGDSFLAGFAAGLHQSLSVEQAVLMGNYFGALAVAQVGVPHFTPLQLQNLQANREQTYVEEVSGLSHAEFGQRLGVLCASQ